MNHRPFWGKLEFTSFFKIIKIDQGSTYVDLRDYIFEVFNKLNGQKTSMLYSMDHIEIKKDDDSKYQMKFEHDDDSTLMILDVIGEFGFSNIGAYLPDMLQRLNGRNVLITATDDGIKIEDGPNNENTFGVRYTNSNLCKISTDKVKEICKIGEEDCCVFCIASGKGFECAKFDTYMCRNLLGRIEEKSIRATRIGDCKLLGRVEDAKEK
jgi:hypothetical protein